MHLAFFCIPAQGPGEAAEELRAFLAGHRIAGIDRQFVADGASSFWAICVSYVHGATAQGRAKARIDYREVLGEKEFSVFAKLRTLRKKLADQEGVPAYALFTNEQLAEMVRRRVTSLQAMAQIDGVGQARISKYGQSFVGILAADAPAPQDGLFSEQTQQS